MIIEPFNTILTYKNFMDRHTRIVERIKEKNLRLYFKEHTTPATRRLIKDYEKLVRLSFEKQLGKLDEVNWAFIVKIDKFKSALKKNEQTKNIELDLSTYCRTFEQPACTDFNQFLEDRHIPLF
jgi:hypothetical protein